MCRTLNARAAWQSRRLALWFVHIRILVVGLRPSPLPAFGLIVATLICCAQPAAAQFAQQGDKLVGTGASGTAFQGYSSAVSADGNTAIVGGYNDDSGIGAAWVFTRVNGVWSQQGTKLVGSNAIGASNQGISVALSADGNTAIVGGENDDSSTGAAWVFVRSGGSWAEQRKLVGTGASGSAQQGSAVALSADGNTALVGGYANGSFSGATWVFTRSGNSWSQQGNALVGPHAVGSARQGRSVALSADGNTAIIGGPADDSNAGAAWIFTRAGNGVWSPQGDKLVGSNAVGNASQGISVSLSADGNTAIVGGYFDDASAGAAWIFTRSNGVWGQQGGKLVGTGAVGGAFQGYSVSLSASGSTAIIGGYADNGFAGASWVFTRHFRILFGFVWSQLGDKLVGTGGSSTAYQGISAALSGDGYTAIVGGWNDANNAGNGASWIFVQPITIAVSSSPAAGGTAAGGGSFEPSTSHTVSATPGIGYRFTGWTENGSVVSTSASYTFTVSSPRNLVANFVRKSAHDFDGDGLSDILWHHGGGDVAVWLMNGTTPKSTMDIGNVATAWQIAGTASVVQSTGDFDGDGKGDFLWRHTGGDVAIWEMNGTTPKLAIDIGNVPNVWQIAGVGDFDGDGKADILWRHTGGDVSIWLMNGTAAKSSIDIGNVPNAWQIAGVGDFDGDGKADILWRNSGGDVSIWEMNGTALKSTVDIGNVPTAWQIVGVADFDGDGKADFLWRHSGGDVAVWLMNGTTPTSEVDVGNVPTVWQIVSTGDYDGDGEGDILWRQSGGDVSVWEMNGATAKSTVDLGNVPTAWTVVE